MPSWETTGISPKLEKDAQLIWPSRLVIFVVVGGWERLKTLIVVWINRHRYAQTADTATPNGSLTVEMSGYSVTLPMNARGRA